MTRMSWGEFKMAPASEKMRYINVKVHDNRCLFRKVNKSSVPAIVPEQSESASFVTLVEIHNVDVPAAADCWDSAVSKRDRGKF